MTMDDEEEIRSKIAKYMKLLLDDDKIEHALRRLAKLPMNLERLSETGVGKAVNQLRNHEEFGEKAQELVAMWKDVARNGGVREHHRARQMTPPQQEAPSESSRRRSRDDHKEPAKKKQKKEHENHKTVAPKGLSFEDMLAKSDAVKHSKPKKPRVEELDWAKHSGNLDPNYRPKPRVLNYEPAVPTVVSDDDRSASGGAKGKTAVLDVNLFTGKNNNTMKMYAGRKKTATTTKVPTLFEMCIRTICENVDAIEDTGDIPFDILKPVLERCSPSQLYYVEQRNTYLIEDSDCLWEKHCQKDFRDCRSHDDETWRECYQRMIHERDEKLKKLSTRIVQHHKEVVSPVRTAKLADAKAPRDVRKRQVKHGTAVVGRELPGALEVSAARREIFDKGTSDSLRQLPGAVRNLNSALGSHSDKKKSATKKGALMVKTLKMLKGRRR